MMTEHAGRSSWLGIPEKFAFFRAQLARRRSSRTGAAGGSGDSVMTWASLDDSSGAQYHAPLLQHDMQEQVRLGNDG